MPETRPASAVNARSSPAGGAIERLFVYWLISVVLLLVLLAAVSVYVAGALQRQGRLLADLQEQVARLERGMPHPPSPAPTLAAPGKPVPAAQGPTEAGGKREPNAAPPPAPKPPAEAGPARQPEPALPTAPRAITDEAMRSGLGTVLPPGAIAPADLPDSAAGVTLLEDALREMGQARWAPDTWARLAVLARLLDRESTAETLAGRAGTEGGDLTEYTEVTVRRLLALGRTADANRLAAKLVQQPNATPTAHVLHAAGLLLSDEPAAADEALGRLGPAPDLLGRDAMMLGRLLVLLERWKELDDLVARLRDVPPDASNVRAFLQAICLARAGRGVEALGMLDYLAAHLPAEEAPKGSTSAWQDWPMRYDVEVWRGVTLMFAGKADAAREALRLAAQHASGRPEAYYYLGLLEARQGRREAALIQLRNAVACAEGFAPGWEALALVELDAGDVGPALEHVQKAVQINSRRASSQFLLALAQAKLGRKEPAATALRAALLLDPRYLDEARQTDVLLQLFTPVEMEQLAAPAESAPAA